MKKNTSTSGGLLAQDSPGDIGPELLAAHRAASHPLDQRAVLGWHAPACIHPLVDRRLADAERDGKGLLRTDKIGRAFDRVFVHADSIGFLDIGCQESVVSPGLGALYALRMAALKPDD